MKSNEKYFSLEFKENVNEMLFQKREFFVTQESMNKRLEYLRKNPDRFCDFVTGSFVAVEYQENKGVY